MSDQAFKALESYDWGTDPKTLKPIDDAIIKSHGDTSARAELESKLVNALNSNISRSAKDYVFRKLALIGTAACVSPLANMLTDANLSHMARYALDRIPAEEATQALRDALPKVEGKLKAGVIAALGKRQDEKSVEALGTALGDDDAVVARAAACALGSIQSEGAAKALASAQPKDAEAALTATDASFATAESLLANGNKLGALKIYKRLASSKAKHINLAAKRGMLACASSKSS